MKDASHVVKQAGPKSLVLIDELGRGTSNKDGSAIAWSVAETLLARDSFTLFVTHYPLLLSLATLYPNVKNVHLMTSYTGGDTAGRAQTPKIIKYQHKLTEGHASLDTDYGIEIASRLGVDPKIIAAARNLKQTLAAADPECKHAAAAEDQCYQTSNTLWKIMRQLDHLSTQMALLDDTALRMHLDHLKQNVPTSLSSRICKSLDLEDDGDDDAPAAQASSTGE